MKVSEYLSSVVGFSWESLEMTEEKDLPSRGVGNSKPIAMEIISSV